MNISVAEIDEILQETEDELHDLQSNVNNVIDYLDKKMYEAYSRAGYQIDEVTEAYMDAKNYLKVQCRGPVS